MKKLFALCLILFMGVTAFAETLALEQARLLALANSRSLAKYEMSIRSSILDERNQLYNLLPSVSAGYNASMDYMRDLEFVNPVDTFNTGVNLSITQIIFQGGKGFIQKAISSIATESVRKSALAEYFNVLDSVDNAYYAVLEAAATLEAEEASLEAAALSLAIAEVRSVNGIINRGDFLKALADKETRENSRNQARRNLALNITKLRNLTGHSNNVEFVQIDFSAYEEVLSFLAGISDEDADALYARFWNVLAASNPSLAIAALNSERAEMNLSSTWRDFYPTISATVFSGGLSYSTEKGFGTSGRGGVSITGSIPLDFWVISNRIEKSQLASESAALDYINSRVSLEAELLSVLMNIFAQAGSVLSSRRSLEYTERHFEFVMERYRLGQSSVSDVSEATSLYINSRNSHTKSRYNFLQGLSKLRSLCALDDENRLLSFLAGN
ncbi:MAG: TolC family protein [Treponema sp.]|jgi:outer membrane protein TolC|nr:TolC family protein [Treponema sp.]